MIRGIHHPAIATDDMSKALNFYQTLLGLDTVFSYGWESGTDMAELAGKITGVPNSTAQAIVLKVGNAFLEIVAFAQPASNRGDDRALSQHGYSHVAFDVDDVWKEYERLKAAGVQFQSEPIDAGPMRVAYCRDPDGNFVELQQITDPDSALVLV